MLRIITFYINGIPFVLPADMVTHESSSGSLIYTQTDDDHPLPMTTASSEVSISLEITSGSAFFINSYALFKAAIEFASYIQTLKTKDPLLPDPPSVPPQSSSRRGQWWESLKRGGKAVSDRISRIPESMKFSTYIGVHEYMEYGQIQSYAFCSTPGSSNLFTVTLNFQRISPIFKKKPLLEDHQEELKQVDETQINHQVMNQIMNSSSERKIIS